MDSLISGVKSALLDPDLEPVWFRQLLHTNVFNGEKFHVTLYEVEKPPNADAIHSTTDISDVQTLFDRIQDVQNPQSQRKSVAAFKFVKVYSMDPGDFLALLKLSKIDDAALLVLNSGPFHFQRFEESAKSGGSPTVTTFGMAYNVATMLWSYDHSTEAVQAVAIGEGVLPFSEAQIGSFGADLTHPLALGLLALQVQLERYHGTNRKLVNTLRGVETDTGHRGKNQAAGRMDFDILERLDLDSISQTVSNIHYEAFSLQRTFAAMKNIVQEMIDLTDREVLGAQINKTPRGKAFRTSLAWRLKSLESLLEQTQYLLNRVQVQETTVVNLRAKKNTKFSLDLAKISADSALASAALAQAAKKDSSSMQTIAVMTMAVLPATFFAALFAMPLLKWDQQPVVQDQFWIYLAFTLPSTGIVFILWAIITKKYYLKSVFAFFRRQLRTNNVVGTKIA